MHKFLITINWNMTAFDFWITCKCVKHILINFKLLKYSPTSQTTIQILIFIVENNLFLTSSTYNFWESSQTFTFNDSDVQFLYTRIKMRHICKKFTWSHLLFRPELVDLPSTGKESAIVETSTLVVSQRYPAATGYRSLIVFQLYSL